MSNLIAKSAVSQLVIVDMQIKLSSVMPADIMQKTAKNCGILVQAANMLAIPAIVVEQYPQGLGETVAEITQYLVNTKVIAKTAFSACGEPQFMQKLHRDRSQIIIAGMEAHICILQTALSLMDQGKQVFVVEDAIISRNENNKTNAINRLRNAGCIMTNTESVLFEWLADAKHESAKAISKLIK